MATTVDERCDTNINVPMSSALKARISELAKRERRALATMARLILEDYMEENDKRDE